MEPVMELRYYFEVFRKRAWIIALLVVLAVGAVAYRVSTLPPEYQTEVSMLVRPQIIAPSAFEDNGASFLQSAYRDTVVSNIAYLLKSRAVLERVADRVGGVSAGSLKWRVTVTPVRDSDVLTISATHEQPARAALIANTTAQEFVNYYMQINRVEATSARKFIEEQLGASRKRLDTTEQALLAFRARTGTAALNLEVAGMVQRTFDMQAAYEAAQLDERVARARVAALQSRLRSQDPRLAAISIGTSPIVGQLREYLTGLELELATLRQVYTDQHPKVQALLGRISDARGRLSTEARRVLTDESLGVSPIREKFVGAMIDGEIEAAAARARYQGVAPVLAKMQGRLRTVPAEELTLARLERDVRVAEGLYVRLSSLHQEAVIRENKVGSSAQAAVVLVDLARIPQQPVPAQLPKKAGFAGLLGLFLGAAIALVLENMDDRIRSSRQAEGAYGVPVLAAIPSMNARTYRVLTAATPGVATVLLSVFLVALLAAAVVGLYITRAGAMPESFTQFGRAVVETLQAVR